MGRVFNEAVYMSCFKSYLIHIIDMLQRTARLMTEDVSHSLSYNVSFPAVFNLKPICHVAVYNILSIVE